MTPTLVTERLTLSALGPEHAEEMAEVLADERLHEFIGGHPASIDELRDRYRKLIAGSGRPDEIWCNWIVRRQSDEQAVGTVQATLSVHNAVRTAYVAWVIGVPWQNTGFASEAARALIAWLHIHEVSDIVAHIHPEHRASATVAARAGLKPTDHQVDGEQVWKAAETK